MKILRKILLIYKSLVPFAAFFIIALYFANKTAMIAGFGWISILMITLLFISRFTGRETGKSGLLWEFVSILFVIASVILRKSGNFETYFIEVTLIDYVSIIVGLLGFVLLMSFEKKKGDEKTKTGIKAGALIVVLLLVGYPTYLFAKYLVLTWFELNNIHHDPMPLYLLIVAVFSSIVAQFRFFNNLRAGKAEYNPEYLSKNKWVVAVIMGGWIIIVPLVAWLIR